LYSTRDETMSTKYQNTSVPLPSESGLRTVLSRTVTIHFPSWAVLALLVLPALAWLLWRLRPLVVLSLFAWLLAYAIRRPVTWLEHHRVRRGGAVPVIYVALLAWLGGMFMLVSRVLFVQARQLALSLPEALARLEGALGSQGAAYLQARLLELSGGVTAYAGGALTVAMAFLLVLVISSYLTLQWEQMQGALWWAVPSQHRRMAQALAAEIDTRIAGYLRGLFLGSLLAGGGTGLGLALLGMPYALLFGLLAGMLEVIPFFEPLLAAVGPVALALGRSPLWALAVIALFLLIQQVKDNLIMPRLQARETGLNPLLILFATLTMGALWGLAGGVVLAVPLAVVGQATAVCLYNCFYRKEGAPTWLSEREALRSVSASAEAKAAERMKPEPATGWPA